MKLQLHKKSCFNPLPFHNMLVWNQMIGFGYRLYVVAFLHKNSQNMFSRIIILHLFFLCLKKWTINTKHFTLIGFIYYTIWRPEKGKNVNNVFKKNIFAFALSIFFCFRSYCILFLNSETKEISCEDGKFFFFLETTEKLKTIGLSSSEKLFYYFSPHM